VTIDPLVLSHLVYAQAHFQASLLTHFLTLCAPIGFKLGQPVYNPIERLANGSTVNNQAVTYQYFSRSQ